MKTQHSGRVTYNGHELEEFVPQRTSAYISQYDNHIGEMTVRETLAAHEFPFACNAHNYLYLFAQPPSQEQIMHVARRKLWKEKHHVLPCHSQISK